MARWVRINVKKLFGKVCLICKEEVMFLNGHYSNAPEGACVNCLKTEDKIQKARWERRTGEKAHILQVIDVEDKMDVETLKSEINKLSTGEIEEIQEFVDSLLDSIDEEEART